MGKISLALLSLAWLLPLKAAAAPEKVRMIVDDNIAAVVLFIGLEKGYFKDAGLEIEPIQMRMYSAGKVQALASGSLDVVRMVYSTVLNEVMPKAGFRIVADANRTVKGRRQIMCILVRKDLAGTVKTFADLKGRSVGLPAPGSQAYISFVRRLQEAGLTLKDVEVRPIPTPQILRDKGVDLGWFWEPLAGRLVKQGLAEVFAGTDTADWSGQMTALFYSKAFRKRKGAAERFMAAYLRSLREYHRLKPEELKAIADKYLPEPVAPEDFSMLHYTEDGAVDADSIMELQDEAVALGMAKARLGRESLFDFSFLKAAQAAEAKTRQR